MVNVKPVHLGETVRMSFSRIDEVLEMPNLIEVQKDSYQWFLDEGLKEVFKDVSGITDYTGNLVLDFVDYKLDVDKPNYTVEECKERDTTYAAALRVTARLLNKESGEIKESEVFMGDFPLMTDSGTFVINGAERVIVSQLVRSPGVYYKMEYDKTGKELFSSTVIPNRGAWLEYENDANDVFYVRIDKNRKIPITVFIRALGLGTDGELLDYFGNDQRIKATIEKDPCKTTEEALLEVYRKLRPSEPPTIESAQSHINALFFDARRYDLSRVGRYKYNKKLGISNRLQGQKLAAPIANPLTGEVMFDEGKVLSREEAVQVENAGVTVAYVMAEGQEEPVKIISNGMVDISCYVDFDAKKECGINEKVRFSVLAEILEAARAAKSALGLSSGEVRRAALLGMAEALCSPARQQAILEANAADLEAARDHISEVMLDRLALTPERISAMAKGIREVADLPDPVGKVLRRVERPNGLVIEKTAVPMGVIAIIYESRPNVTSDAAALAIKSGNACILRCGREAWRSANAIVTALREGLRTNGLPETAVCLIEDTTHASANALMTAVGYVDLLIPRGGAGLIRACVENAKVPCIQTGTGICHIFVDASAEQDKALDIIENAKASRPSVCNAEEVCLVHRDIAAEFLPKLARRLGPDRTAKGLHPVELRLDPRAAAIIPGTPAGPADFDTEFLDYILAVKVVDSVEEAVSHIAAHSTGHSEAILTRDEAHAALFTAAVDSAAVYVNCSTRFTDGGEFGLGCEMGISTQKLHARGPMGLEELCSYKYIIHGSGQIR